MKKKGFDFFPLIIAFFAVLSYSRIFFLRDVFWDDNCWLMAAYASSNLDQFLNTGFYELRREPLGIFLYNLFTLHGITDYVYFIWHSISISIQIATPIFLYLFIRNLFEDKQLLSCFAALSLIVFPLDTTLPYLAAINYRIATMLTLISFYLTERSFAKGDIRWTLILMALAISAISHYVFLELTIVFELPRLFLIGYLLYKNGAEDKKLLKKTLSYWALFFILCIPLVIYKLTSKPYGIYGGIYKTDLFFLLNWKEHREAIRMLLFKEWRILSRYISDASFWSVIPSIFAAITGFLVLARLPSMSKNEFGKKLRNNWLSTLVIPFFGVIFLIPPIFLLEFAGREIGPGMNSSHFAPAQIGYAIILGSFLYSLYYVFNYSHLKVKWFNFLIAILIGSGVFFNNLNLNIYLKSWENQLKFWQTFTDRFPSLPKNAVFMMDVSDHYFFDAADLDNTYDLEFVLNLLYANSKKSEDFRKFKVFPMEEFKQEQIKGNCSGTDKAVIERMTHFGRDVLDPCEFIVVRYINGELLVNREIIAKYPDIPYRAWADKDFPELPMPASYPLRYKFRGLDNV